eukprot:scaffold1724_cov341-Pavlova_lutheri.AAC.64
MVNTGGREDYGVPACQLQSHPRLTSKDPGRPLSLSHTWGHAKPFVCASLLAFCLLGLWGSTWMHLSTLSQTRARRKDPTRGVAVHRFRSATPTVLGISINGDHALPHQRGKRDHFRFASLFSSVAHGSLLISSLSIFPPSGSSWIRSPSQLAPIRPRVASLRHAPMARFRRTQGREIASKDWRRQLRTRLPRCRVPCRREDGRGGAEEGETKRRRRSPCRRCRSEVEPVLLKECAWMLSSVPGSFRSAREPHGRAAFSRPLVGVGI